MVVEDVSAGNQALTGGNAATGIDTRRAWEAIVEDINKRGRILGLKVEPVFHQYSATSEKTQEQQGQEACANFTEDHEVFAALATTPEAESFFSCLERAEVAYINGTAIRVFWDDRLMARYPHMILPFGADLNTQAKTLVNSLVRQKYFAKDARIGLLTFDDPGFVYATERSLIPAMKKHGLKLTDWVRVSRPASYSDYGRFSSEIGNAVVTFKSENITHVMILDIGANNAFFFMQQAEKQQYRPRYGLTSQSGGTALADLLGEDARGQLKGARGIGWVPVVDLRAEDNDWVNQPMKRCIALMKKAGVEMSSSNAQGIAITMCDQMWFLQAALEAGGRSISLDSLLVGVDRLGRSYASAVLPFGVAVSGSRHDGLGAVANISFFGECRCFRYTTKPYSIPN